METYLEVVFENTAVNEINEAFGSKVTKELGELVRQADSYVDNNGYDADVLLHHFPIDRASGGLEYLIEYAKIFGQTKLHEDASYLLKHL